MKTSFCCRKMQFILYRRIAAGTPRRSWNSENDSSWTFSVSWLIMITAPKVYPRIVPARKRGQNLGRAPA